MVKLDAHFGGRSYLGGFTISEYAMCLNCAADHRCIAVEVPLRPLSKELVSMVVFTTCQSKMDHTFPF